MAGRVPYSAAQAGQFVPVPGTYVSQLMRQVDDLAELKVALLVFYLLSRSRDYPAYVGEPDVLLRGAALLGMGEEDCRAGLDGAVQRGVFLRTELVVEGAKTAVLFANIESDLEAIDRLKTRSQGAERGDAKPVLNIFELYEQNFGMITPIVADELKDAQRTYPAEWIEEAFREAVRNRKLNWKYVSRILERWTAEGKDSGAHRAGARSDDRDKYIKGRFGHLVKR
jgi:DNA replication protein